MRMAPADPRSSAGALAARPGRKGSRGRVVVIDDDGEILDAFRSLLELEGYACEAYTSAADYLRPPAAGAAPDPAPSCILLDVMMPDLDGLEAQRRIAGQEDTPVLLMSGASGVQEAVTAFRAGAQDFLIKPVEAELLLAVVERALEVSRQRLSWRQQRRDLDRRFEALTQRELEVVRRVARGDLNRVIAQDLRLALRTVKLYRQRAMEKLDARSTADLVRTLQEGGHRAGGATEAAGPGVGAHQGKLSRFLMR